MTDNRDVLAYGYGLNNVGFACVEESILLLRIME
jgi:hypothetical protein